MLLYKPLFPLGSFIWICLMIRTTFCIELDLMGLNYIERNGGCFIDLYFPLFYNSTEPEPLQNFHIFQAYQSKCYNDFAAYTVILGKQSHGERYIFQCFYFIFEQQAECNQMDKFGNFSTVGRIKCNHCIFGAEKEIILTVIPKAQGFKNKTQSPINNSLGSFNYAGHEKYVYTDFPLNLTGFGDYAIVSNYSEIHICETSKFQKNEKCSKMKNNYETKFSTPYRSIYDRLQAYYNIILPFPRRFVGVDYLEGKCKIQFVDALSGEKCGKLIPIDCVSGIKSKAFGVSSVGNNTYQFYACFLILNNSQVVCHVFKNWRFFKAFSHTLEDNCRKDKFQPNDETRMFIGSLASKSSVLNGIVIISGNSSCFLQVQMDQSQTIFNETLENASTFGQGYDPIRDKFLSYDDIGFVVPGWKKPVQKFPLFSHGGYIFLKEKEKYQIFSPDGIADEYDLKFSAIIDQPYLDPEIFQ